MGLHGKPDTEDARVEAIKLRKHYYGLGGYDNENDPAGNYICQKNDTLKVVRAYLDLLSRDISVAEVITQEIAIAAREKMGDDTFEKSCFFSDQAIRRIVARIDDDAMTGALAHFDRPDRRHADELDH